MEGFRIPARYNFVPYDVSRKVKGASVIHYFDVETDEGDFGMMLATAYEVGVIYTKHVARDRTHILCPPVSAP